MPSDSLGRRGERGFAANRGLGEVGIASRHITARRVLPKKPRTWDRDVEGTER
jgi:hypothetical protein